MNYDKKELIINNTFIVKHMASKFYINDFDIEYNELLSLGMNGLVQAVDEYNVKTGVKFSSFASNHIKRQMLDYVRREVSLSKEDFLLIKKLCDGRIERFYSLDSTKDTNESHLFNQDEISDTVKNKCLLIFIAHLDEFLFDSTQPNLNDSTTFLLASIKELSYLEKVVLSLCYKDDLTYFQISKVLNVPQSVVFNIHMIALSKLRYLFKKYN